MKYIVGFFLGVGVGLAAGLLFAPLTGEELRGQIHTGAEAELKKAEAEWQKLRQEIKKSMADSRREMKDYMEKAEEEGAVETGAETEATA
jgi:gas vesicle protein